MKTKTQKCHNWLRYNEIWLKIKPIKQQQNTAIKRKMDENKKNPCKLNGINVFHLKTHFPLPLTDYSSPKRSKWLPSCWPWYWHSLPPCFF